MEKKKSLLGEYQFPGFRPKAGLQGIFGDQKARVIQLERTQKKQSVAVVELCMGAITTRRFAGYGIYPAGMHESIWKWRFGVFYAGSAGK
jgi:hypothetical protein